MSRTVLWAHGWNFCTSRQFSRYVVRYNRLWLVVWWRFCVVFVLKCGLLKSLEVVSALIPLALKYVFNIELVCKDWFQELGGNRVKQLKFRAWVDTFRYEAPDVVGHSVWQVVEVLSRTFFRYCRVPLMNRMMKVLCICFEMWSFKETWYRICAGASGSAYEVSNLQFVCRACFQELDGGLVK